jgi:hypothetical protein
MAVRRNRSRAVAVAIAAAVSMLAVLAGSGAARAASSGAVGPNQYFVGTVNHRTGLQAPAPVRVACAGPAGPNRTTHPLAHQPVAVVRASASNSNAGFTGPQGARISSYLGIPPSAAGTGAASGSLPSFTEYGAPQDLPTSITVPCSGTGYITFIPWPRAPGQSRAFVMRVQYVNIAV